MGSFDPDTITVIQTGKIGDMILTTPLLRKLKEFFPLCRLQVLGSPQNDIIAKHCGFADAVHSYSKNPLKDINLMFSGITKSSLWIDPKPEFSTTSSILRKLFRPDYSIGYNSHNDNFDRDLREFRKGDHFADICLAAIPALGFSYDQSDRIPQLNIPSKTIDSIRKRMGPRFATNVLLNISAGKEGRKLRPETWIDVLEMADDVLIAGKYIISHPDDSGQAHMISKKSGATYIATESILEAAAAVSLCSYVITPDTSIVHLCSAFNKPVVAVYPNVEWNLRRFYPLGNDFEIVISDSESSVENIKPHDIGSAFMRLVN